jgi:hypothetical protein
VGWFLQDRKHYAAEWCKYLSSALDQIVNYSPPKWSGYTFLRLLLMQVTWCSLFILWYKSIYFHTHRNTLSKPDTEKLNWWLPVLICQQYIFSLSIFVIKNKHLFCTNYQNHSVHTRFKTILHLPIANLTKFQKGVYYSGNNIFNNLPHNIKDLANKIKLFWNALKRFLLSNSFYNSEEYFNYQR